MLYGTLTVFGSCTSALSDNAAALDGQEYPHERRVAVSSGLIPCRILAQR
jgi:hypothetical protein